MSNCKIFSKKASLIHIKKPKFFPRRNWQTDGKDPFWHKRSVSNIYCLKTFDWNDFFEDGSMMFFADFSKPILLKVFILEVSIFLIQSTASFETNLISILSWSSSGPEFCVIWPWKRHASGWGSFWESSSFVPWLILNAFRESSGVVPEWPCSSGLIRKLSRRANAPSKRFSVLLNSFDNLLVTLPSISPETWVMQSSCDLGAFEFCVKLLLGCSSQFSLFNAANFLLFRVVIFHGKSKDQ